MEKIKCAPKPSIDKRLALRDAIELLSGKWKVCILTNLYHPGTMRFKDILETSKGITPKVLSKELQQLEENLMITRTVNITKPVTVSYALTDHASKTQSVIQALISFGLSHRTKIKNNNNYTVVFRRSTAITYKLMAVVILSIIFYMS